MASPDTLLSLAEHPDWLAPRSDRCVFLGEPGAPEATKTTVEPGNAFSPGMGTFGVTWWLLFPDCRPVDPLPGDEPDGPGLFYAPETAPLASLRWSYEQGFLPIIHCETEVEGVAVRHTLFQDGTAAERSEAVAARLRLRNVGRTPTRARVFIALRSLGPAGGPVRDLVVGDDDRSFWLARRKLPLLVLDRLPDVVGCGIGDPAPFAREGNVPTEQEASDSDGWAFGLARYDLELSAGESWQVCLDCPQPTHGNLEAELPGTAVARPEEFESRLAAHAELWRERLGKIELDVPDRQFRDAFFAGLQHMLTATVGDQARIAPLAYPLPWLRDSVFIMRCFDLAGQSDIARATTEYCVRNDFFGGCGAEGDAPGEGIWALTQYYRISRDQGWLVSVYPAIRRKVDWLYRMRRATAPIQVFVDTPTLAFTHTERASGVICLAARDGIIMGAMDHGVDFSLGWINQWAIGGLREAAFAARELDHDDDAAAWEAEAADLRAALVRYAEAHPEYNEHDRTVINPLWPSRAFEDAPDLIAPAFDAWWTKHRGDGERFRPEPHWLYFELAQAHNALLLGQVERVWQVIRHRLTHQDLPGLFGWREGGDGVGTRNAVFGVTIIGQLRGCQRFESITPHGWSQAEMFLLQRAVLVEEWQDGLLLFGGVPADWLQPGARIAFASFPTWYGQVSAELLIDSDAGLATVRASGLAPGIRARLRLFGQLVEEAAGSDGTVVIGVHLGA